MQRFQLSIGQLMIAIAVCAIIPWSPKIIIFAPALVMWSILIVGGIHSRTGCRFVEWRALAVGILVVFALYLSLRW